MSEIFLCAKKYAHCTVCEFFCLSLQQPCETGCHSYCRNEEAGDLVYVFNGSMYVCENYF